MFNPFHPLIRKAKQTAMANILAGVIRHLLTAAGGAGLFSDNDVTQIASGLAALGGIIWSVVDKRSRASSRAA